MWTVRAGWLRLRAERPDPARADPTPETRGKKTMETEIAYMRIENPTGNHDIVRACFAAAGLPWQNAPSEPEEQEHILQEDEDARLVVIALANAMPEAPERMRGTVEWQDFTDPVSDNNTSAIPWCQMLALLSTHEELDDWLERADQHLETARETKRSILPNLAANGAHRNEELISKAVEEATSLHQRKFGETPKAASPSLSGRQPNSGSRQEQTRTGQHPRASSRSERRSTSTSPCWKA